MSRLESRRISWRLHGMAKLFGQAVPRVLVFVLLCASELADAGARSLATASLRLLAPAEL